MLKNVSGVNATYRDNSLSQELLSEELFIKLLSIERKRTERSGRRFVLMLLDPGKLLDAGWNTDPICRLIGTLSQTVRDTDLRGWYREHSIIGVIFTELDTEADKAVIEIISDKLTASLESALGISEAGEIKLSFHLFPEDWSCADPDDPLSATLRTSIRGIARKRRTSLFAKRSIDVIGSLLGLLLCLPVIALIAVAIKLTSKGPVLFRQTRLGQHGKEFTFLKFRSMYTNNDHQIHQEYVSRFIDGNMGTHNGAHQHQAVYKLTRDPRITPLGRMLRAASLDELPQFLNVLNGDMSLVGPRPPVEYEFTRYRLWHKQRLMGVKPGITGAWQVEGRSRVTFDDMVRLDIRYARTWSVWLDIKIMLMTPRAVITGSGAW